MALERCLPGEVAEGVKLKDGSRLKYPLNGHLAFWISLAVMIFTPNFDSEGSASGTLFDLSYVYDHYIHLATAALVIAVVLTVYLYVRSFREGAVLAPHGDSGNFVYVVEFSVSHHASIFFTLNYKDHTKINTRIYTP